MIPEINQSNVHIFIPFKVGVISDLIAKEQGISIQEALLQFYASKTYDNLENEETKTWYYSPWQLYEIYKEELSARKA